MHNAWPDPFFFSEGMSWLNGVYTQKINRSRKRVGHLFQGRFKSILVQKESHLLEVARYSSKKRGQAMHYALS